MNAPTFEHRQASHCESGVVSALVRHSGVDMSEPMAFGLSSALSFAYLPFIKLNGLPLIAYRMPPKSILRGLRKPLGWKIRFETFRSPKAGRARLDQLLDAGRVVGLQTSVFWLPYFPQDLRFHFNAHNLLVFGREGDGYRISDPVFEEPVVCEADALDRARFARGVLAPKGLLYYAETPAQEPDWNTALLAAMRRTCRIMLKTPLPLIGVRGIHWLARTVRRLSVEDARASKLFVGHIVRMQEEIGTGGAGFRFIEAAFLQEAAALLNRPVFAEHAEQLIAIGDAWREFALTAARMCRDREPLNPACLADALDAMADRERSFFQALERSL